MGSLCFPLPSLPRNRRWGDYKERPPVRYNPLGRQSPQLQREEGSPQPSCVEDVSLEIPVSCFALGRRSWK